MSQKILVIGASGLVGGEVARLLRASGHDVRTTTSQKSKVSPSSAFVNLQTGEGLTAAFDGIDRAYFMSPGGIAEQYEMLSPLIQEAKRRGLQKVVLMTAMGANADESSDFRRAELDLERSGLNYNIIRPNWFMDNFTTFWIHGIKTQNQIGLPVGDARTSFVDTRDVAEAAAKLLLSDELNKQEFDLTGPESLTHADVAAVISNVSGRQITYQDINPAALKEGLLGAGLTPRYSDFLLLILGFLKAGYSERRTDSVQKILGRAPRNFQSYAVDHRASF